MIRAITLCVFLAALGSAFGQCTIAVPSTANVQNGGSLQVFTDDQFHWVCQFGSLSVTGNGNTVLVENLGLGVVSGNNNTVITKDPVTTIVGTDNTVYIVNAAAVNDQGTNTTIITCPAITFIYDDAPADGCAVSVGLAEQQEASFILFPNPVVNELTLIPGHAKLQRVRLYDTRGTLVLDRSTNLSNTLDVADLPAGLYMLMVDTDQGTLERRLVKDRGWVTNGG